MVERFDGSPEMQPYRNGDWVRYSDYAELEAENERLRFELTSISRERDQFKRGYDELLEIKDDLEAEVARLKKENANGRDCIHGDRSDVPADSLGSDKVKAREALSRTGAVKVKALEWEGPFKPGENGSHYDHIFADSPIGRYTFDWKSWKEFDPPTSTDCPGDFFHSATDLDDAKAAAQADYERRIRSALEPAAPESPQPSTDE